MDDMSVETKALQAAPFFAGLSPEDIGGIVKVGQPVTFGPGQAMVEQGDAGDGMYIVVSGTAEVDVGGRFHKLTAGNFFERERDDAPLARWLSRKKGQHLWNRRCVG